MRSVRQGKHTIQQYEVPASFQVQANKHSVYGSTRYTRQIYENRIPIYLDDKIPKLTGVNIGRTNKDAGVSKLGIEDQSKPGFFFLEGGSREVSQNC